MTNSLRPSITQICVIALFAAVSQSSYSQSSVLTFDTFGTALEIKKLSPKHRGTLKKFGITESEPDPLGLGSSARVGFISGAKEPFVFSQSCNAAADGSSEDCAIDVVAGLESGRKISLPKNEPLPSYFRDQQSLMEIRLSVNEKNELVSMIAIDRSEKSVKKEKRCANRATTYNIDVPSYSIKSNGAPKSIGSECFVTSAKDGEDHDRASSAFTTKLASGLSAGR